MKVGKLARKKVGVGTVTFAALAFVVLTAMSIVVMHAGLKTRAQERPVAGWVTTTGTIVDIHAISTSVRYVYGPVISFVDSAGISHRFTAPTSSVYPPAIGTAATVSYDPRNPTLAHYLSDSTGTWQLQLFVGILGVSVAGIVLLVSGVLLVRRRKRAPQLRSQDLNRRS